MKKFLSVLLALAVAFTFTFGSSMSAFAATYSLDDYVAALQAEKTAQIGYMNSAKTQAVGAIVFDDYGFNNKYSKAAYEAAADAVIADVSKKIDTAIASYLEGITFPMDTPAAKSTVSSVVADVTIGDATHKDATTAAGMAALMAVVTNTTGDKVLDATQAPLTKKYVEDQLASVDLSKYNATDKVAAYDNLTAAQYVQKLISEVNTAIANTEADASKDAAYKVTYYYNLYFDEGEFKATLATVPTLADEEAGKVETAKTVAGAAKAYVSYAIANVYPLEEVGSLDIYTTVEDKVGEGALYNAFYEPAVGAKKATVFGVEVGNIAKVTKTELTAINNALYNAIIASEDILVNSGLTAEEINALYTGEAACLAALDNTMNAADKYAEVVAYGEKLKGAYYDGIKEYDDAKVDAAVAAAKKLVYTDINNPVGFNTAESYLIAATENGLLDDLRIVNFELQKFQKAQEDAILKMYKGYNDPQVKVLYGDNKTAEADYVYLKETYFTAGSSPEATATAAAWKKIADEAVDAIDIAQSYDDINAALATAAAEFSKLLTAADGQKVIEARTNYCNAIDAYADTVAALLDPAKYTGSQLSDAVDAGQALINEATTVDAVKAAYEEAKTIIDNVKSDADLAAAKAEIEAKIAGLPITSLLTSADKDAVKAVVDAYAEYKEIPGAPAVDATALNLLKSKYERVIALVESEIAIAAKDLVKKLDAVNTYSDADLAAYVGMKSEAEALKAKGEALLEELAAVNDTENAGENKVFSLNVVGGASLGDGSDFEEVVEALDINNDQAGFYEKEIYLVYSMLTKAGQAGATEEEMKAALEAYNNLTDAQKYGMTANALPLVTVIENKLAETKYDNQDAKADLLDMARKLTIWRTTKTSIRVSAVGSVKNIKANGYTVKYSFYKKAPGSSTYKLVKTQSTYQYTYTNLKKGTNKFQVKVSVYDPEGKLVASKWTYYRAAKIK